MRIAVPCKDDSSLPTAVYPVVWYSWHCAVRAHYSGMTSVISRSCNIRSHLDFPRIYLVQARVLKEHLVLKHNKRYNSLLGRGPLCLPPSAAWSTPILSSILGSTSKLHWYCLSPYILFINIPGTLLYLLNTHLMSFATTLLPISRLLTGTGRPSSLCFCSDT